MYQVTYQKRNGEIFNRIRNTLPNETIGEHTSMGWLIVDIKRRHKDKFYSASDYHRISSKSRNRNCKFRIIKNWIKKYATTTALIILIPLYFIK